MATNETDVVQGVGTGLSAIKRMVKQSDAIINQLRLTSFDPQAEKQLDRRYSITTMAKMVGRSDNTIRKAELDGTLPMPALNDKGRRVGYILEDVNRARAVFGTMPSRADNEQPIRLAFQNFKGGVGKSTMTAHFSQYLAERGYRVLVVDVDSQASTTTTFGYRPDSDLDVEETLSPFLSQEKPDLTYAVKPTYWDQLDLIPANLGLYAAEYQLAARAGTTGGGDWMDRLRMGLQEIEGAYDVVIMDPPPALGMLSLNVVRAANALIIPTSPAMYDYHSTVTFLRMMEDVLTSVGAAFEEANSYKFLKLLVSKYDTQKTAQQYVVDMMQKYYAEHILRATVKDSAEIDNAAADWRTVYELAKPFGSRQTYKRCLASLDSVFTEIETLIRLTWPSHRARLEAEGRA